jgi:hypothetical protein
MNQQASRGEQEVTVGSIGVREGWEGKTKALPVVHCTRMNLVTNTSKRASCVVTPCIHASDDK